MPNSPRAGTRVRAVRLPDSLWQRAKVVAERDGTTASEVTRRALERYTMQDSIYSDSAAVRDAIRAYIASAPDDDDTGCEGHESLDGAHMGEAVYCDGTCRR